MASCSTSGIGTVRLTRNCSANSNGNTPESLSIINSSAAALWQRRTATPATCPGLSRHLHLHWSVERLLLATRGPRQSGPDHPAGGPGAAQRHLPDRLRDGDGGYVALDHSPDRHLRSRQPPLHQQHCRRSIEELETLASAGTRTRNVTARYHWPNMRVTRCPHVPRTRRDHVVAATSTTQHRSPIVWQRSLPDRRRAWIAAMLPLLRWR